MITGTLGKALGSYGGFVACDHVTARFLVHSARTLLHSTALPPVAAAAAMAALDLLEEQPRRVDKLRANAEALRDGLAREGFEVSGAAAHVVPLVVGDAELALPDRRPRARAGRLRRGRAPAARPRGHRPRAAVGDGLPHPRGAARAPRPRSAARPCAPASAPAPASRSPRPTASPAPLLGLDRRPRRIPARERPLRRSYALAYRGLPRCTRGLQSSAGVRSLHASDRLYNRAAGISDRRPN